MWSEVIALFRNYMGTGLIVICFMISLIYLWVNETRKYVRILFLYMPVVILLLYFNPLFAAVVYGVTGSEIYYRILWLLPITIVIAYTCAHIYGKLKGAKQGGFALCIAALIMVSGSYIYGNPYFAKAENIYHVPDCVVDICDAITVPGREVRAVFPEEFLQYVRQYDPTICMPYGREVIVEGWSDRVPFHEAMEAEVTDWDELAPMAIFSQCHYIVLPAERESVGDPADYGIKRYGQVAGYVIYRNMNQELVIPQLDTK